MEEQEKQTIEIEETLEETSEENSEEEKDPAERQTYKFMDCKACKAETRFISTLSPSGDWVCCRCRAKVFGKARKLSINNSDCRIINDGIKI